MTGEIPARSFNSGSGAPCSYRFPPLSQCPSSAYAASSVCMLCSCLMVPPPYPSLTRQATQKAGSGAKFPGGRGGRGTRERGGGERGGGRRGGGEHPVFQGWCAMKEGLVVLRKERGQEVEGAKGGGVG